MLMRFEQFRGFDRLTQEMLSERRARPIPVDAYHRGNEFTIHLDLPGVDPGFIEVTAEKDLLTVRATRAWVPAEEDCRWKADPLILDDQALLVHVPDRGLVVLTPVQYNPVSARSSATSRRGRRLWMEVGPRT